MMKVYQREELQEIYKLYIHQAQVAGYYPDVVLYNREQMRKIQAQLRDANPAAVEIREEKIYSIFGMRAYLSDVEEYAVLYDKMERRVNRQHD